MTRDDPFATLAIAPTLDLTAIKRAYFAALATTPHVDREGFRRLRSAYEELVDEGSRKLAFLRAPAAVEVELAQFDAQWGARIEAESAKVRLEHERSRAIERFTRRVLAMSWDEIQSTR